MEDGNNQNRKRSTSHSDSQKKKKGVQLDTDKMDTDKETNLQYEDPFEDEYDEDEVTKNPEEEGMELELEPQDFKEVSEPVIYQSDGEEEKEVEVLLK